ncbi:hypothetical protein A3Q56_05195 [Intoshia linei]|uniref:Uncharacterized protein n=1 Tax=Intoshia linei TaxID=1819745 RepID=A0A177B0W1_9BILA|nr:hypothetical protein A3Q56_05195 [Intoshia linei]
MNYNVKKFCIILTIYIFGTNAVKAGATDEVKKAYENYIKIAQIDRFAKGFQALGNVFQRGPHEFVIDAGESNDNIIIKMQKYNKKVVVSEIKYSCILKSESNKPILSVNSLLMSLIYKMQNYEKLSMQFNSKWVSGLRFQSELKYLETPLEHATLLNTVNEDIRMYLVVPLISDYHFDPYRMISLLNAAE